MSDKLSDKVFASTDHALGHGGEKVPILGFDLVFFKGVQNQDRRCKRQCILFEKKVKFIEISAKGGN